MSAMQSASGGNHGSRSWEEPRQSLMVRSYRKIVEPCQPCSRSWGKPPREGANHAIKKDLTMHLHNLLTIKAPQ